MTTVTVPTEIQALAQKMFNDDGYMGNLYDACPSLVTYYENRAIYTIEDGN